MRSAPVEAPPPASAPFVEEPFYARRPDQMPDLRAYLDMLVRGRRVIAGAVLLVTLPVLLYTLRQPSVYQSYALLLVDKQNHSLADVLPTNVGAAFFRAERNLGNELLVLRQSAPLAERAARLLTEMRFVPGTDRPLTILQPERGEVVTPLHVAFRLQSDYVISGMEGYDTDAIRVSARSTDPDEAALIANVYAETFVNLAQESSRASASASRTFLEDQVGETGASLRALDDQVKRYMMREEAVALDSESQHIVSQLAQLEARRDETVVEIRLRQTTVDALEAELARIEPRLSERLASGVDREIEAAQTRTAELEARLEQIYLRNPHLREAASPPAEIADLRRQIEQLRDRTRRLSEQLTRESIAVGGGGPGDTRTGINRAVELRRQLTDERIALNGLVATRDQLSQRIGEYERGLRSIPRQSIELAQMQRERMAAERLYGSLEQKLQEARVAEQSQLGYARVIRPAYPSDRPIGPKRVRNVLLALLVGLSLGVVAAIARVRLDHRLHRPDDLQQRGHTLIGTIPDTDDLIKKDFGGKATVLVGERAIDTHLVTLLNPMSTAAETYRALRTSVQFSRPDAEVRTILVTSANPSEGKSVTSANLAVVLAQAGRRVLFIDADLRKPSGHKKFGLSREPGLVQMLFQSEPVDWSALPEVADDLFMLAAGSLAPNPSELLGSRRMRELLEEARQHFDVVVLDAPPVLAATDAVLLSTQADATLVVVRAGQTKDYELASALEALDGVGAHVIGTVLNGFDVSQAYGYKYKYTYRYGSDYAYGHESTRSPEA
ncbi:MAG: polysaccharide biosynthesis tyrosine autokinase [Rubricoccaceae bacterium]